MTIAALVGEIDFLSRVDGQRVDFIPEAFFRLFENLQRALRQ